MPVIVIMSRTVFQVNTPIGVCSPSLGTWPYVSSVAVTVSSCREHGLFPTMLPLPSYIFSYHSGTVGTASPPFPWAFPHLFQLLLKFVPPSPPPSFFCSPQARIQSLVHARWALYCWVLSLALFLPASLSQKFYSPHEPLHMSARLPMIQETLLPRFILLWENKWFD